MQDISGPQAACLRGWCDRWWLTAQSHCPWCAHSIVFGNPCGAHIAAEQALHCSVPPGHRCELVVDPGPGVLLVMSGASKALVCAGAVSDELVLDEADLHASKGETAHWQCMLRENGPDLTAPLDA